jgi:diaminopropionate ammonia-lyase
MLERGVDNMAEGIKWIANPMVKPSGQTPGVQLLAGAEVAVARRFHQSIPGYSPTPLISLTELAGQLGVGGIYVKDESQRFALNAFKVLGGSYAMARYLSRRLGDAEAGLTYERLAGPEARETLGEITFATATDGNHGRGVAWAAKRLGHRSVVYMPKGSSLRRLENIRAEGAEASITELNYDEAVRQAAADAEKSGWVVVQDTAWPGYEEIPAWIMQGYGTMVAEALEQLNLLGVDKPTHVFIQAGVGSLAAAVQGFFAAEFDEGRPITVVVEPDAADCFYRSVLAGDGEPRNVGGDMNTIMAGLACGEPNRTGWEILRDCSQMFVSCPDWVAAKGMRLLGNPLAGDGRITSGESGAVTAGLLAAVMSDARLTALRQALRLDAGSRVLLFSTEGDTDPEKYRSIVWDGEYSSCGRD